MAAVGIEAVRALLGSKPRPVGWTERRARIEEVGSVTPPAPDIILTTELVGGVTCEWSLAPGSDASKVLVFFHGGGFCSGSIVSHRRLVTEAGRAAGMRTLAVGYRLAPEHPFPAAPEDALAVYRALLEQGYGEDRIVLGGDSAGGGLSVAVAVRTRELGLQGPACLWLLSPWTDLALTGATLASKDAVDPLIHKAYLDELASAYVPTGVERTDPAVSVLYADMAGCPPMLIQVGSDEALLSDATRLAERAGGADVKVHLEIWPHMIHAFPLWNGILPEGRDAIAEAGRFIKAQLA